MQRFPESTPPPFDPLLHRELIQAANEAEQERLKADAIEVLTKILSAVFEKMSAYTSLIVIGGYAAFFSIWGVVEKFVTPWVRLLSFGLLGVSILMFALSEAFRITRFSTEMQQFLKQLKQTSAVHFRQKEQELTGEQDRRNVARFASQKRTFAVTAACAIIAALILFYGVAEALLRDAKRKDTDLEQQALNSTLL